jgi:hypothetical protein
MLIKLESQTSLLSIFSMDFTGAPPSVIVTDVEGDIVAADSLDSDYDYEDNGLSSYLRSYSICSF